MEHECQEVRDYWCAFADHLRTLPVTCDDVEQCEALVVTARSNHASGNVPGMEPVRYAELAHRLRFTLGPTLEPGVVEESYRRSAREAEALLASGVSPRLLGLGGGGVVLG